jgi:toxin-antitoxin system PIN domain toxin
MFAVDTNVLLHAVDEESPFHRECRDALIRWRTGDSAWFTTWSVVYEFLRVATHPGVARFRLPIARAWDFVEGLLMSPGLTVLTETDRHAAVAAEVLRVVPDVAGNFVHDAHIAILMREHGVRRIYTRDVSFKRFSFLEVVDPVATAGEAGVHERQARYEARGERRTRR